MIGTLVVVFALTLALGTFFSWQHILERRELLARLEKNVASQLETRLQAEMSSAFSYLDFTRSLSDTELRRTLVDKVDSAMQIAEAIHATESGRRPDQEVRRLIVEALRKVRFFDGRGYYFIDDLEGRFVLLPTAPQLEGRLLPDNQDDTGRYIMRGLIDAAREPAGKGFFNYRWYRPNTRGRMADKLAYVRHFAPYNWLIGSGDYTDEWDAVQQREAMHRLRTLRFGKSGYIGLLDSDGQVLLSPSEAVLERMAPGALSALQRDALAALHRKAQQGGGLLRYEWIDPQTGRQVSKLALVRIYEPWGWTVVATVLEDELRSALEEERISYEAGDGAAVADLLTKVMLALVVALAASFLFSYWSRSLFRAYYLENVAQRDALRRQALELRESEDKLAVILDSVEAYIYIKGSDYCYQYANRKVCEFFGRDAREVIGRDDGAFFDHDTAETLRANDARVLEKGEHVAVEELNVRHGEEGAHTFLSVKIPLRHEDGHIYALCGISTDITQRKTMEEEIKRLAFYDSLTGLPNRRLLIDRLQQQLTASVRGKTCGALLFIDLDNFKTLNDTLGHDKGDLLLRQVAERLVKCVRDEDTVARLGGDEFVVMLGSLEADRDTVAASARTVAEKIIACLGRPHVFDGQSRFSTPSIGITLFAGKGVAVDDLLRQADLAMYQAKAAGRNTLVFFDPEMQAAVRARAELEADLHRGLELGEFELHYQAQVDYEGRLIGAEALLRWKHPERGMVGPADFVPAAEETGLILPLGAWVLDTACAQLREWGDTLETAALTLSVNVSARQFRQPDFVEQVLAALDRSGANGRCLKIELTESLLLQDVEATILRMAQLRARGVGFSLDDFGTGYSSLAYLKRLPLDQLKIDRSFVRDLLTDPSDAAIARAIITLAESLGLSVIAEGVETLAQRDALARQGCLAYQGYYFGRPGPVAALFESRP
nr:EAL domain-containing protein [Azoarcus sp. L1K30]